MTTNELLKRGIGHNCLADAYELGKADGYHKAENDYFAKTQKDRENAYNCGYEKGGADAIEELLKKLCIGCAYLKGTKCEIKGGCPCSIGQSEIIRSANKVLKQLKEQKVCSNGQICKHPNCPKCGTTHSMSECGYTRVKEEKNE